VLAKVHRDQLMADYAQKWPDYGFERHKGYPTAAHCKLLTEILFTANAKTKKKILAPAHTGDHSATLSHCLSQSQSWIAGAVVLSL
ncbi:MAG: hypothetical protein AAFO94_13850, partial [Bacteroidota bacterium]